MSSSRRAQLLAAAGKSGSRGGTIKRQLRQPVRRGGKSTNLSRALSSSSSSSSSSRSLSRSSSSTSSSTTSSTSSSQSTQSQPGVASSSATTTRQPQSVTQKRRRNDSKKSTPGIARGKGSLLAKQRRKHGRSSQEHQVMEVWRRNSVPLESTARTVVQASMDTSSALPSAGFNMPQLSTASAANEARRKFRQHEARGRQLQQMHRSFKEAVHAFDEAIAVAHKEGRLISPHRIARVHRFKAECLDQLGNLRSAYSTLRAALAMLSNVQLSMELKSLLSDFEGVASQNTTAAAVSVKIDRCVTLSEGGLSKELKTWFELTREIQRLRINAADTATKRASIAFESRNNSITGYKLLLPHEERSLRESAALTARLLQVFESVLSQSRCLSSQYEKWRQDGAFDECRLLACQVLYGLGAIHNELGDAFRAIRAVKRSKRDARLFAAAAGKNSRFQMKLRRHYVRCCLELGRLFGELHLEVPQRRHLIECKATSKSLMCTLRNLEESIHTDDVDVTESSFPFISTDALNSDAGSALMQLGMSYLRAWDPTPADLTLARKTLKQARRVLLECASSREVHICSEALREAKSQSDVLDAQLEFVETLGQTSPENSSLGEALAVMNAACLKAEERRGAAAFALFDAVGDAMRRFNVNDAVAIQDFCFTHADNLYTYFQERATYEIAVSTQVKANDDEIALWSDDERVFPPGGVLATEKLQQALTLVTRGLSQKSRAAHTKHIQRQHTQLLSLRANLLEALEAGGRSTTVAASAVVTAFEEAIAAAGALEGAAHSTLPVNLDSNTEGEELLFCTQNFFSHLMLRVHYYARDPDCSGLEHYEKYEKKLSMVQRQIDVLLSNHVSGQSVCPAIAIVDEVDHGSEPNASSGESSDDEPTQQRQTEEDQQALTCFSAAESSIHTLSQEEREQQMSIFSGSILVSVKHLLACEPGDTDDGYLLWKYELPEKDFSWAQFSKQLRDASCYLEVAERFDKAGSAFEGWAQHKRALDCFLRSYILFHRVYTALGTKPWEPAHTGMGTKRKTNPSRRLRPIGSASEIHSAVNLLLDIPNSLWRAAKQCASLDNPVMAEHLLSQALTACKFSCARVKRAESVLSAQQDAKKWPTKHVESILTQLLKLSRKVHLDAGVNLQDLVDVSNCRRSDPKVWRNGLILAIEHFNAVLDPNLHPRTVAEAGYGELRLCDPSKHGRGWDTDACKALINAASVFLSAGKVAAAERCARVALSAAIDGTGGDGGSLGEDLADDEGSSDEEFGESSRGSGMAPCKAKAVSALARCLENRGRMFGALVCYRVEFEICATNQLTSDKEDAKANIARISKHIPVDKVEAALGMPAEDLIVPAESLAEGPGESLDESQSANPDFAVRKAVTRRTFALLSAQKQAHRFGEIQSSCSQLCQRIRKMVREREHTDTAGRAQVLQLLSRWVNECVRCVEYAWVALQDNLYLQTGTAAFLQRMPETAFVAKELARKLVLFIVDTLKDKGELFLLVKTFMQVPLLKLEQKFDHFDFPYALEWAKLAVGACNRQCGEYARARKMAVEVLHSMRNFVIQETDVPAPSFIGRTQYLDILRRAAAFTCTIAEAVGLLGLTEVESLWLNDTLSSASADAAANFCLELDSEVLHLLQACAKGFSRALSFLDDHDRLQAKISASLKVQSGGLEPTLLSRFDQEIGCSFFNPVRHKAARELRRHLQQQLAVLENSVAAGIFVGFDSFEAQARAGTHFARQQHQATCRIQERAARSLSLDAFAVGVSSEQSIHNLNAPNTVRLRENRLGHLYKALLPSQGTGSGRGSPPDLFWVPLLLRRIDFDGNRGTGFRGAVPRWRYDKYFRQFEDGKGDDGGADVFDFESVDANNGEHDSDERDGMPSDTDDGPIHEISDDGEDDAQFLELIRRDTTMQRHFVDRVSPRSLLRPQSERVFSGAFVARKRSGGDAERHKRLHSGARQSRGSQQHGAANTLTRLLKGAGVETAGPIATPASRVSDVVAGNTRRVRKNRLYARDFLSKAKSTRANEQLKSPRAKSPSSCRDGVHPPLEHSTVVVDTALDTSFAVDVWLSLDDELVPPPLNNIALNDESDAQASVVSFDFERDITSGGLTMTVADLAGIFQDRWRKVFGFRVMVDPRSIELRYAASPFASEYTSIKIGDASSSSSCVSTVLGRAIEHIRHRHDLPSSIDILGDLEAQQCLSRLMFAATTVSQTGLIPCPPLERLMATTARAGLRLVDNVAHALETFQASSEQQFANDFLASLPTVVQKSISLKMLVHVSFANFGLHDAMGPSIVEALMFAGDLKVLDLHGNMLGDRTARWFVASSMKKDNWGAEVAAGGDVVKSGFGGAESESLETWPRLEFLFAHDNAFTASEGLPLLLSSAAIGLPSLVGLSASCVHDVMMENSVPQSKDMDDENAYCSVDQIQRLQPLWGACVRRLSMLHVDWGYQPGVGNFKGASSIAPCLAPFFQTVGTQLSSCQKLVSFRAAFLPNSAATASLCQRLSAGFQAVGATDTDAARLDEDPPPELMIDLSGSDVHCDVDPPLVVGMLQQLLRCESGPKAPVQLSLRLRDCGLYARDATAIAEYFGQLPSSDIQGRLCLLDLEGNPEIDEEAAERLVVATASWTLTLGRRDRVCQPLTVSLRRCNLHWTALLDRLERSMNELCLSTDDSATQRLGVIVDLGQNVFVSRQRKPLCPSELHCAATKVLARISHLHKEQSFVQFRI